MYRRIRDLREDRDLKQRQLAEQLGCSQKTYSDYETGKTHVPVEILMGLSEIYGTSVDYLVELTDEKKPYPRQNIWQNLVAVNRDFLIHTGITGNTKEGECTVVPSQMPDCPISD